MRIYGAARFCPTKSRCKLEQNELVRHPDHTLAADSCGVNLDVRRKGETTAL